MTTLELPATGGSLLEFDRVRRFRLSNGTNLVVLPRPGSSSVSLKFYVGCGSQFEKTAEHGICHMLEHYLFKATRRRSGQAIYESIENYGGQINAATHREYLVLSAHVPADYWQPAVELLSEILSEPAFDPVQLEQEKKVVLEEIARKQDKQDQVWDVLLEAIWGDSNFSRPILGTPQTVTSFQVEDVKRYYGERFSGPNTAVAIVGPVDPEQVARCLENALTDYPAHSVESYKPEQAGMPPATEPRTIQIRKNSFVTTVLMGWPTVTQYDRATSHRLKVLNRVLGVGGMGWLRQELREKHNLVYSVQSASVNYATCGYLAVMFTTMPKNVEQAITLVREQMTRLQSQVTEENLARNRTSYAGSLSVLYDNNVKLSEYLGLNALMAVEDSFEATVRQVSAVTPEHVHQLAKEYFNSMPYLALLGQ